MMTLYTMCDGSQDLACVDQSYSLVIHAQNNHILKLLYMKYLHLSHVLRIIGSKMCRIKSLSKDLMILDIHSLSMINSYISFVKNACNYHKNQHELLGHPNPTKTLNQFNLNHSCHQGIIVFPVQLFSSCHLFLHHIIGILVPIRSSQ